MLKVEKGKTEKLSAEAASWKERANDLSKSMVLLRENQEEAKVGGGLAKKVLRLQQEVVELNLAKRDYIEEIGRLRESLTNGGGQHAEALVTSISRTASEDSNHGNSALEEILGRVLAER